MAGITNPLIDLLFLFLIMTVMLAVIVAISLTIYGLFFKKKN
jgi:hypothetical protein